MVRICGIFFVALAVRAATAPDLEWVREIGGTGAQVTAVGSDGQGGLYIAGNAGAGFPATRTYGKASGTNAFVVRLDGSGTVVYAVKVGGSGTETPAGIAVAGDGSVVVGGTLGSLDFPATAGAYQTKETGAPYPGFSQTGNFLFRLAPDGTLAWASYFADGETAINAVGVGADGSPWTGARISEGHREATCR